MSGSPESPSFRAWAAIFSTIVLKASRSEAVESRFDLASASRIPRQQKTSANGHIAPASSRMASLSWSARVTLERRISFILSDNKTMLCA